VLSWRLGVVHTRTKRTNSLWDWVLSSRLGQAMQCAMRVYQSGKPTMKIEHPSLQERSSFQRLAAAALAMGVALTCYASGAQAGMIGPVLPYFGLSQSPFNGLPFSYFHLETFEEGALTAPGVTASTGMVSPPSGLTDSVEGPGPLGHSFFAGNGAAGITFTFDAAVLGHLPTHVGIVWTDGDGPNRTFKAFDASNALIGTIIDPTQKFFSTGGDGDTSNYRFFGATDPAGISSIFIANDGGGIEVDDLQYGLSSIPEPGTLALTILPMGILVTGAVLRRPPR